MLADDFKVAVHPDNCIAAMEFPGMAIVAAAVLKLEETTQNKIRTHRLLAFVNSQKCSVV